jgi:hypothetical protein
VVVVEEELPRELVQKEVECLHLSCVLESREML